MNTLILSAMLSLTPIQENLLLSPVYLMLGITAHESAHYVAAKLNCFEVTSFKPYPHFDDGHFYFGRIEYIDRLEYAKENAGFLMAPMIFDLALISITDIMLSNITNDQTGIYLVTALMIVPLIDFTYNVNNRSDYSDMSRSAKTLGLHKNTFQFFADVIVIFEAMRVYKRMAKYLGWPNIIDLSPGFDKM